jgi:rod shape-determining protein MreD
MNIYVTILLLGTTVVFQATAMPHLTILGVKPDLVLLMVISWSLLRGAKEGLIWALVGGIGLDLLSGASFGTSIVPLVILGLMASLGELSVFRTRMALPLVAILIASLVYNLFFLLLLYTEGRSIAWADSLTKVVLPSTLFNVLLSPLVYRALYWLHRKTGREELAW